VGQPGALSARWSAFGWLVSSDGGVAVGERGAIVKSADRGNTWRAVRSGTQRNLNGLRFVNRQTGFAVGDGGIILRTDDTGESWRQVRSPAGVNLRAIRVASGSGSGAFDIGLIVGDRNLCCARRTRAIRGLLLAGWPDRPGVLGEFP